MQVEMKVKVKNVSEVIEKIQKLGARFWKKTHETDTYFASKSGVLKLKETSEGECLLIHDYRPKESGTSTYRTELPLDNLYSDKLVEILKDSVGARLVLSKKREQYIFHGMLLAIDAITGHETFLEITSDEIQEKFVDIEKEKLVQVLMQCGFSKKDLETKSYVDLYL